jgi:membrane dipeptidase
MKYKTTILAASALLVAACGQSTTNTDDMDNFPAQAQRIAKNSVIVDTHIDVPMKIFEQAGDVSTANKNYDFDYPRAVAGGLNAPFMSIYTDSKLEAEGRSREVAEQLIDLVEQLVTSAPDKFAIATSPAEVRKQMGSGLISLPLGMENGSPIEGDLANLQHFYDRGIRYITLAHGLSNHISDSSYDTNHQWNGLSEFGVEVVREMNHLGIMVDVSHVSDDAFWQVMDITEVAVIASHSSARYFTPGFERNMSDEMIKRLAENGGVIQINFGSGFVNETSMRYGLPRKAAAEAFMKEHPDIGYSDLATEFLPQYEADHGPYPHASLDDVLDHFDHIVALAGIDHVGIGSDFDGVGDSLPTGLKDVSSYPNLIEGLLRRGYSEDDIRKILGENLLRVWGEVEAHAAAQEVS